ncbi:MAG: UDP-glucose/GDP-mannose dehydrogenase family protein, partial [Coriobacteriales bacterium]|nr:UDP-glucose/GDP-mannose dehydrogenase family protein [Coriobacteriales bacterium]
VRTVVAEIAAAATEPITLVMKSTVPPGTGDLLKRRYLDDCPARIGYVSNPEVLREGQAIRDWLEPDRIVLGGELADTEIVSVLYKGLETPVVVTDVASAETIKYASNAFLSTKISCINEIANLCDCVDADVDAVAEGIGLDMRIGSSFLHAGVGYGGSCFPKDTRALDFIATLAGYKFDLLKAVIDVNNAQRLLPVKYLTSRIPDLFERKVAILGLSFKPHTDDVRESPAIDIVPLLAEEGCRIDIYDPLAHPLDLECARRVDTVWEALEGASAAVLLTEWPELVGLDWKRAAELMAEPAILFDGRNALDATDVRNAGLTYAAIGRDGDHRKAR